MFIHFSHMTLKVIAALISLIILSLARNKIESVAKLKIKKTYLCQNCGSESPKWTGQCKHCGQWNTLMEEILVPPQHKESSWNTETEKNKKTDRIAITEVVCLDEERLPSGDTELDRVLGGGIVPGSIVLTGGEPGIGKSTLFLQIALQKSGIKTLYASGEESEKQIRIRADRLGLKNPGCFLFTETSTQLLFKQLGELQPDLLIIDSIQTLQTIHIDATPGSVSQIRECTGELLRFAKKTATSVILIGHITKDGLIAGPKILEHMVDVVLQFEGDRHHSYRILRAKKNRFGSTTELGIYEMQGSGLKPVHDLSKILITRKDYDLSGNAIAASLEGLRPMLIEVQALVSSAVYGTPQRSATGFDIKRLNMLLAVLEKRAGFQLASKDVFLNITGGIRIDDPAMDLSIAMAVLSSHGDIPLPGRCCFTGEIGLNGEIRPVHRIEQRILEAERLGFDTIFISGYNKMDTDAYTINIIKASKIEEVFRSLF